MLRNFPLTTRRRAAALVTTSALLLSGAVLPSAAADTGGDLKHKKHQVQKHKQAVKKHLSQAHQDLDESSSQLQAATAALATAQQQLGAAQSHLATTRGQLSAAQVLDRQMQAKLDAAVARLKQAQDDLVAGQHKIAEQEHELGQIIVSNYQNGDPQLMGLSMVLTTQDPAQLTGQLNSVQNVMDKENVVLSRLEATKVLLTVQEKAVAQAKAEVAVQREAAARNLVKKKALEKQAREAEAQVQVLVSQRAAAKTAAARARAADIAQLHSLQKENQQLADRLRAIAAEEARRAEAAAAAANSSSVNGNGFLSWPVNGPVTSPFGWRIHPIFGYRSLHDGIDIGAACGTPIHAPAGGTVLEEYFQTAWGNRIVINHGFHHGVGVATIINHLEAYAVPAGAHVKRGEVIGYIGTTGWSTGCHTHFTVMVNGAPVDPMGWL